VRNALHAPGGARRASKRLLQRAHTLLLTESRCRLSRSSESCYAREHGKATMCVLVLDDLVQLTQVAASSTAGGCSILRALGGDANKPLIGATPHVVFVFDLASALRNARRGCNSEACTEYGV
jgi:hypothetical protein